MFNQVVILISTLVCLMFTWWVQLAAYAALEEEGKWRGLRRVAGTGAVLTGREKCDKLKTGSCRQEAPRDMWGGEGTCAL